MFSLNLLTLSKYDMPNEIIFGSLMIYGATLLLPNKLCVTEWKMPEF